jgi:hypothetical protein
MLRAVLGETGWDRLTWRPIQKDLVKIMYVVCGSYFGYRHHIFGLARVVL